MDTPRVAGLLLASLSLMLLAGCNEDSSSGVAQAADARPSRVADAKTPREVCTERVVTTEKPVKDEKQILGTVAGAVVGGVVGNELGGKGTSGDIATVGGAVAGGYAGNRIQKSMQDDGKEKTIVRECRMVYD